LFIIIKLRKLQVSYLWKWTERCHLFKAKSNYLAFGNAIVLCWFFLFSLLIVGERGCKKIFACGSKIVLGLILFSK